MAIDPRLLAAQGTVALGDLLRADAETQGTSQFAVTAAGSRTHYFVDNAYPAANEYEDATGPTYAVGVSGVVDDLSNDAGNASTDFNSNE